MRKYSFSGLYEGKHGQPLWPLTVSWVCWGLAALCVHGRVEGILSPRTWGLNSTMQPEFSLWHANRHPILDRGGLSSLRGCSPHLCVPALPPWGPRWDSAWEPWQVPGPTESPCRGSVVMVTAVGPYCGLNCALPEVPKTCTCGLSLQM